MNGTQLKRSQASSVFDNLPDEMVLTILSYSAMEDIQSTRVWQSKTVQNCTTTRVTWEASQEDNLDTMKWIYEFIGDTRLGTYNYLYCGLIKEPQSPVESAADNGNLMMLKWLKEKKCPWGEDTFYFAAKRGSLENIKWLKENECPESDYKPSFY